MALRFTSAGLAALALLAGTTLAGAAEFRVTSTSPTEGTFAPAQYAAAFGCTGGNQSPQLAWQGAPEGTKSFVVTLYDPDAPTGSGFWHWAVANLPASTTGLAAGAGSAGGVLPGGARPIANDAGVPGYLGACPPVGETHRYVLSVHALKVEALELPLNATPALLGFMVHGTRLGTASLTIRAGRWTVTA